MENTVIDKKSILQRYYVTLYNRKTQQEITTLNLI